MKRIRRIICLAACILLLLSLASCTKKTDAATLTIAYQYGMAYSPLLIMKEQQLIEKYAPGTTVEWTVLNSGSAINEGIASGSVDVGAMGVGPAITGVMRGIPYRIFSAVSSQPQGLMTSLPDVMSLADITADQKIALVNIGSIQHILLAMAAKAELGDAHALDNNIVAMAHPDGMAALLSGSVSYQLTTSPYIFKELNEPGIRMLDSISNVWPDGNTFIVAVAAQDLYDNHRSQYDAVVKALQEACAYIENNPEEVAALLCENEGVDEATMLSWLQDPACGYATETVGVLSMAQFMAENGFLDVAPESFSDLAFENVLGN